MIFPAEHLASGCFLVAQVADRPSINECIRQWRIGGPVSSVQTIIPFARDRAVVLTIQRRPSSSA